jgi:hypothetical protein
MGKRSTVGKSLRAAVYGIVAGVVGGYAMHLYQAPPPRPPVARERVTTLVTSEGDGNCRKAIYSKDAPHLIAATIVRCETVRGERTGLPPVLEGYQASLRAR